MKIIENLRKEKLELYKNIKVNDTQYILVGKIDDEYYLRVKDYSGICMNSWEFGNYKRLSTINKYARCYGIEFYE